MSTRWLQFIPLDPTFRPSLEAAEAAKALLHEFAPGAGKVDFAFSEHVDLHHPVENWSGVKCPFCSSDLDDAWWFDAVDAAWKNKFVDLDVTTPCCGRTVSLNNLNYVWPAGFSKFLLEARDPEVNLLPEQVQQLEQCLGCGLRRIWMLI